jgi:hypothetical protein
MRQVILVTGYARAGKDTFGSGLRACCPSLVRVQFSSPLKEAASLAFSHFGQNIDFFDDAIKEQPRYREVLLAIGKAATDRETGVFAEAALANVKRFLDQGYNVVLTDWRRPIEYEVVRSGLASLPDVKVRAVHVHQTGQMASSPWEEQNVQGCLANVDTYLVEAEHGDRQALFDHARVLSTLWNLC